MALVQVRDYFLIPEPVPPVKCLLSAGSLSCSSSRWTELSPSSLQRCEQVCDWLCLGLMSKEEKISSFKSSWHPTQSPLRSTGVSGSDLCINSRYFQTKEKKIWFSLAQRIWVYFFLFKGGRKPPKTCICFPLKIVLLAGDHLSCVQALKCTFSLSSFLTTEETGCTLPSAIPGTPSSTWWKISTSDGQGWCTALSITSRLLPVTVFSMGPASSSSTSTEHWGEPVRVPRWTGSKPLGFFSFQFWFFLSLSHS